jgi:hypothetical protein
MAPKDKKGSDNENLELMPPEPRAVGDALRAVIAGGGAAETVAASTVLFEAAGRHLLDEVTRSAVRSAAERGAQSALVFATGPLLGPATVAARRPFALLSKAGRAARAAGPMAVRAASREILKTAGKAASIGFVIDGAIAGVEAIVAVRNGSMDRSTAASYVATEAATGAVATGAGVLVGASLVALTGGVAAPVAFAAGALGCIGTKRLLRRIVERGRDVDVRELAPSETST